MNQIQKPIALALLVLALTACSKPAETPKQTAEPPKTEQTTPPVSTLPAPSVETVDVQVRQTIQSYFDALNTGDEAKLKSLWSAAASTSPLLPIKGVSAWHLQSTELISFDEQTAYVQVNFDIKVEVGSTSGFNDGKNVRFFRLGKEQGAWKIRSIQTSP